jgi:hypothetical protein
MSASRRAAILIRKVGREIVVVATSGLRLQAVMREVCDRCESPLVEIDHYGERLVGCLECNVWKIPVMASMSRSPYPIPLSFFTGAVVGS